MAFELDAAGIAALLTGKDTPAERDVVYGAMLAGGQVPAAIKTSPWPRVKLGRLEILTAPDVWSAGTNANPFRALGATPHFAQRVASAYFSILPSRKLQRDCQVAATHRIPFVDAKSKGPFPLSEIEKASSVVTANRLDGEALAARDAKFGAFVRGYCKAIVCGPNLDGTRIAIYGASWDGTGTNVVQPYSTIHTSNFSDYSHGIFLVHRRCFLDGEERDLRDLFLSDDPTEVALVSDQGRFDPTFPNATKSGAGILASLGEQRFGLSEGPRARDAGTPAGPAADPNRSVAARMATGALLGLAGAMALSLPPVWIACGGALGAALGRWTR